MKKKPETNRGKVRVSSNGNEIMRRPNVLHVYHATASF